MNSNRTVTVEMHDMAIQRRFGHDQAALQRLRAGQPLVRIVEGEEGSTFGRYMARYEMAEPFTSGEGGAYPWNRYTMTMAACENSRREGK